MSVNSVTLSTIFSADAKDAIATKLVLFYYKTIQQYRSRLRVFTPRSNPPIGYNKLADDLMIIRFSSDDTRFWNMYHLTKLLEFMKDCETSSSVFIEHGYCLPDLKAFYKPDADITAVTTKHNLPMLRHINSSISKHCRLPVLADAELISYDFRAVSVSEKAAEFLRKVLKQIITKYPNEYISPEATHAILSYGSALARRVGLKVHTNNADIVDVADEELLGRFYAI